MQGGDKTPDAIGEVSLGPTIFSASAPVDLPDDFPGVVPVFVSRRKADSLPVLRPVAETKGFDWSAWRRGFVQGILTILFLVLVVRSISG